MTEDMPRPLLKEIARPGTFTDAVGTTITFTPEDLGDLVQGSAQLMDAGFRVQGYTSHFTDDSRDVLGTWLDLSLDDRGCIMGVFQPFTEEARTLAMRLDTSMVAEEEIHIADGVSVPRGITRVDIVPQGAIVGTASFVALARKKGRRFFGFGSSISPEAPKEEEKHVANEPSMLMSVLAKATGMAEGSSFEDIEAHLTESLQLLGMAEDEGMEAMANVFAKAFMPDTPEEYPEPKEEAKPMSSETDADAEERGAMAAEISDLQEDKFEGLFSDEMPDKDKKEIKAQFSSLRKSGVAFSVAYGISKSQVALLSRALRVSPINAAPPANAQVAARKSQSPDDAKETKRLQFSQSLAKAAIRMGHKPVAKA